ncbi:MAG: toll/interleukin-1 receptor domain-containing protein [Verrucomicrobia bacterium]|nr:toll/interleukin-1 receptor domain-containing protein [Verrucomicrobiota bacterium]
MLSCPRYQIFVSYAHVDNQAEAGDLDGWVTHLVRELERRVIGQIGREECVQFKIDQQLNGYEQLDEQIRIAIRESSIFLLIGSNGYLASDWCMNKELPQFLGDFGGERIFIVEKMPYDRAALPRPVANRVGKTFWEEDKIKGEWRTFGDPVATALTDVKYQERINRLSQEMAALLRATTKPDPSFSTNNDGGSTTEQEKPAEGKPAVYLAESSEDLEEDRDGVRSYLLQHNISVFSPDRFPADPNQYRAELKKILHHDGIVFAQLLSGSRGRRLAEGDDTSRCVRLQYEVAAGQRVPIYQWRSRSLDVETVNNEDHRALLLGSDVQVSSLEEFKALLVDRAQVPPARVVVSRDKDVDDQLARQVLATVRELTYTADVAAITDQQELLESKLRNCEALIFVHGSVQAENLLNHFKECSAVIRRRLAPPPARAILTGPPPNKQPLKFRFVKPEPINCEAGFDPDKLRDFFEFMPRREE